MKGSYNSLIPWYMFILSTTYSILNTGTHYSEWPAGVSVVRRNDHFENNVVTLERHLTLGTLNFCLFQYTLLNVIAFFKFVLIISAWKAITGERITDSEPRQSFKAFREVNQLQVWMTEHNDHSDHNVVKVWHQNIPYRSKQFTSHMVFPEDCRFTRKRDI